MKFFIAFLLLLSAYACHHATVPQAGRQTTDSTAIHTVYKEIVKDSTIQSPADSAWLTELLACDSTGQVYLKQLEGYKAGVHAALPQISLANNVLHVTDAVDSFKIYWYWKELHTQMDTIKTSKEIIKLPPVQVNYVTGFQTFMIKSGWAFWVLLLLVIAWKILSIYFPILKIF